LLHHLQAGEGTSAAKPARTEDYERPERPERRERRNFREDRRERFEDRRPPRYEQRERAPRQFEDRPPRSAMPVTKTSPRPVIKSVSVSAPAPEPKKIIAPVEIKPKAEIKPAPEKTFSDEEILKSVKAPSPTPLKSQGDKLAGAVAKPK